MGDLVVVTGTKPFYRSKTFVLGVLTVLSGLGMYAGYVSPKYAPLLLFVAGAAGLGLRIVTDQPIDAGNLKPLVDALSRKKP